MKLPTVVVRGDILGSWLTLSAYSRLRLATELGVSKGRVSQLLSSLSPEEPSAHLMAKLMAVTNLPFDRLFKVVRDIPRLSPKATRQAALRARRQSGNGAGRARVAV